MTTAPYRNQHMVGVRSVFSLPASAPGHPRSVAVTALLNAVRAVAGVRHAELRTAAGGDRTLHLDLIDGADEAAVAWSVTRILDERLGVEVDQTRSVLVDDGVEEARSVPLDGPQRRVHLERLQVVTGGLDVRVDVALATAQARVVGSASGPAVERTVLRTVAGATLNAVDALLEGRARCGLDQAELTDIGSDRLAVAVVTLLTPGQVDRLAGAALVRGDARQAMVRAVLSALNRRFESLLPENATAAWAPSFPPSAPPLAVENTATFRTITAGVDAPVEGVSYDDEPLLDPVSEDAAATAEYATVPDDYPVAPERVGRAARRAAAAASYDENPPDDVVYADASTTGDVDLTGLNGVPRGASSAPRGAHGGGPAADSDGADLGDWAAATWARLTDHDVAKDAPERYEAAPVSPAPDWPAAAAPAPEVRSVAPFGSRQAAAERSGNTGQFGVVASGNTGQFRTLGADRSSSTGQLGSERSSSTGQFGTLGSERSSGTGQFGTLGSEPPVSTSGVFSPPAEPTWTPPTEPTWSWPASDEPAPAAEWAPPRWDQPVAEEPRPATDSWDVVRPYSPTAPGPMPALTSGAGASNPLGTPPPGAFGSPAGNLGNSAGGLGNGGLGNGGLGNGGLGRGPVLNGSGGYAPGYLEREYGGLAPAGRDGGLGPMGRDGGLGPAGRDGGLAPAGRDGGLGPSNRSDAPSRPDPSGRSDQLGRPEPAGRPEQPASRPEQPVNNGWGRHGREASGPLPLLGQGQPGQPLTGQSSFSQPTSGQPAYGQPTSGQPATGRPGFGNPYSTGPGIAGPNGAGPNGAGPNGAGPNGAGPNGAAPNGAGAPPVRRRHAAADTGTWPIHDPLTTTGSWADPQAPAPRDPAERGYRNGGVPPGPNGAGPTGSAPNGQGGPERWDQQPPRPRRRYAEEESGRHGGGR